jgi:hypothetical protein
MTLVSLVEGFRRNLLLVYWCELRDEGDVIADRNWRVGS